MMGIDASDNAVKKVLYQDAKLIAFERKKLTPTRCRYSIQEKEVFAIIHTLKSWRHYVYIKINLW